MRFHGGRSERNHLKKAFMHSENRPEPQYDLCVTTYESYVAEDSWFKSRRWTYCVLDEGHRIKNSETILAHKVQGIGSLYRLSVFPTPRLCSGEPLMTIFWDSLDWHASAE
jgi:SWI/SNF-related matrix-associated actin-dependent regulator of chromatin subfamily A member 5